MNNNQTYLILAKGVYDSENRKVRDGVGLLVQDENIAAIKNATELIQENVGIQIKDYKDYYLFPGLINTHVHLECNAKDDFCGEFLADTPSIRLYRAARAAHTMLCSGVTTVRDAGGSWGLLELLNPRLAEIIHLPRLQLTGPPLTVTGGHMYYFGGEADTSDQLLRAVRIHQKRGCGAIKIVVTGGRMTPRSGADRTSYSAEQIREVTEEAHRLGLRTLAHCLTTKGFVNSMEGGVQCIDHCACFVRNGENGLLERVYDAPIMERFRTQKIFFSKTMASLWHALDHVRESENVPSERETFLLLQEKNMFKIFLLMKELGFIPVLATDAGVPKTYFDETWLELEIMTKYCGLSAEDVIDIGTINSAACLGVNKETGMLKTGYSADIVVLEENPLKNIRAYRNVHCVISRGKVVADDCYSGREG